MRQTYGTNTDARKRNNTLSLDDVFYCRPRRRRLEIDKCLTDYMNANALNKRRAACWRCPQGCQIRVAFAMS